MLKDINIFNVKFGDCFILQNAPDERPAKMLVDFGSIQKIDGNLAKAVSSELRAAQSKYLMITHFHGDHYKGIKKLDDDLVFDEIYLPNYFAYDIIRLQFTLLTVLGESHPAYRIAYNLLSVIPDLESHLSYSSVIRFVKQGEQIDNAVDSFRVLWPKPDYFEKQARELYSQVADFYRIDDELKVRISQFTEEYLSAFPPMQNQAGGNRVMYFEGVRSERLQSLTRNIEFIAKETEKPRKRLTGKLGRDVSNYQNSVCICFDSERKENSYDNSVLFLSDLYRPYLRLLIDGAYGLELHERYRAIKAPHHGTKDYYVDNLPASEYILISNGYAKDNGWQIFALYGRQYNDRKFICTGYKDACDYCLSSRKCDAFYNRPCTCGFYPNTNYVLNL